MNENLYLHGLIGGSTAAEVLWARPVDWLSLPDLTETPTTQQIKALVAVYESDANYIGFVCEGNYIVDWGDGVIENVASGVKAQHQYVWETISSDSTTSLGYRQAVITIYTEGINTITLANFYIKHDVITHSHGSPLLEIKINCPSLSSLSIGGWNGFNITYPLLEKITLNAHNLTGYQAGLFSYMPALKELVITTPLSGATDLSYMVEECSNLVNIEMPSDTSNCTNFSYMFSLCPLLRSIPQLNTISGENFNGFVYSCTSIEEIPLIDTSNATTMSYMFFRCVSLKYIPQLNTSNVTSFLQFAKYCKRLKQFPLLDTSSAITCTDIFYECDALEVIPALNLISCTSSISVYNANLRSILCENIKSSQVIQSALLDRDALVTIFNNLSIVVDKSINIAICYGTSDLTAQDLLIATDKGWTVVT